MNSIVTAAALLLSGLSFSSVTYAQQQVKLAPAFSSISVEETNEFLEILSNLRNASKLNQKIGT